MDKAPKSIAYSDHILNIILGAVVISAIIASVIIYKDMYRSKVYACSEVNKNDPADVQKLCKQLKRIYE